MPHVTKTKRDTISLNGGMPIIQEAQSPASGTPIMPGHLVQYGSTAESVTKQSTAGAVCRRAFALESAELGQTVDTAYATNDRVKVGVFHSGQTVLARVASSAPAIAVGDALEAKGDGTVRKLTNGAAIGYAVEAVNNSSGTTETFIAMEVL